jgi:hypothetical protein
VLRNKSRTLTTKLETTDFFYSVFFCMYDVRKYKDPVSSYVILNTDVIQTRITVHHHHHHRKNDPFWVIAFRRRFCQIPSGFHFFGFRNNFFYRGRSSILHPTPNLEDHVSIFMSPMTGCAQLYPQAPGLLFFAFYDSQGYGGDIATRLQREE